MTEDPNLDLSLDYSAGINAPLETQEGFIAIARDRNLAYVEGEIPPPAHPEQEGHVLAVAADGTLEYIPADFSGTQGPQGAAGAQGAQGAQGAMGLRGLSGDPGPQGATGAQGAQGAQGVTGAQGPEGKTGEQGPQGEDGRDGPQGPQGSEGLMGERGPMGFTGPQGEQGPEGPEGPQGAAGPQGATGAQGSTGAPGTQGAPGPQGATGAQGPQGAAGQNGPQGATGAQGQAGPPGATGAQGAAGPQGATGATGATGVPGTQGAAGPQGATGPQGPQGTAGQNGPQGATGAQGPQGATGPQGAQGATGATGATGAQGAQGSPATPGATAYGEIYVADNVTELTLTTKDAWYKWTANWNAGECNGVTANTTTEHGLVVSSGGVFRVSASLSMQCDAPAQRLEVAMFVNGVYSADHSAHVYFVTANQDVTIAISGIKTLAAGDIVTLRFTNTTGNSKKITLTDANMSIGAVSGATGAQGAQGATGPASVGGAGATVARTSSATHLRLAAFSFDGTGKSSATFHAILESSSASYTAYVGLYDVTAATWISASVLSTVSTTPAALSVSLSVPTNLPAAAHVYEVHLYGSADDPAYEARCLAAYLAG